MENTHPNGIHLFRCQWNDTWYGPRKEFIFALDKQHASDIVEDRFNFDNNVTELNLAEIQIRPVTRIAREGQVQVRTVSNTPGEGIVKSSCYMPVTRFFCSHCNTQVMPGSDFCDNCGGYFTKGSFYS